MINLWHLTPMSQRAWAEEAEVVRRYDRIAGQYDAHYRDQRSVAEDLAVGRWLLEAGALPGPPRTLEMPRSLVVDVGCGTGLLLDIAAAVGHPIHPEYYLGIDPSHGMLEVARERWPDHRFEGGYAEMLAYEVGTCRASALVGLFGPYNYAQSDLAFWEAARVLRPGGVLFLVCYSASRARYGDYICGLDHLPPLWTADGLRNQIAPSPWWQDVRVWGMSSRPWHRLASVWPMSTRRLASALRFDAATIGRWRPTDSRYLVLTATRSEIEI